MSNLAYKDEYANGSYKVFTRADLKVLCPEDPDKWSEICQAANRKRYQEAFWKIYFAIKKLVRTLGRFPTQAEIGELSGCCRKTVRKHLQDLRFIVEYRRELSMRRRSTLEGGMGGGPEQKTENLEPVAKIYGDIERSRTQNTPPHLVNPGSKAFEGDTEQGFAAIRARNLEKVKVLELLMLQPSG